MSSNMFVDTGCGHEPWPLSDGLFGEVCFQKQKSSGHMGMIHAALVGPGDREVSNLFCLQIYLCSFYCPLTY